MKKKQWVLSVFLIGWMGWAIVSCDKKEDPVLPKVTNLEIGSGDNGIGVVGADFHLELDIEAGDRIDLVTIRIVQRANETYSHAWDHQVVWDGYRGQRNAHIHAHFDIPDDAATGRYDFVVTVSDQNGTSLDVRRDLTIQGAGE